MGGFGGKGSDSKGPAVPAEEIAATPSTPQASERERRGSRVDRNKRTTAPKASYNSLLREPKQGESTQNGQGTGYAGGSRNTLLG